MFHLTRDWVSTWHSCSLGLIINIFSRHYKISYQEGVYFRGNERNYHANQNLCTIPFKNSVRNQFIVQSSVVLCQISIPISCLMSQWKKGEGWSWSCYALYYVDILFNHLYLSSFFALAGTGGRWHFTRLIYLSYFTKVIMENYICKNILKVWYVKKEKWHNKLFSATSYEATRENNNYFTFYFCTRDNNLAWP